MELIQEHCLLLTIDIDEGWGKEKANVNAIPFANIWKTWLLFYDELLKSFALLSKRELRGLESVERLVFLDTNVGYKILVNQGFIFFRSSRFCFELTSLFFLF